MTARVEIKLSKDETDTIFKHLKGAAGDGYTLGVLGTQFA